IVITAQVESPRAARRGRFGVSARRVPMNYTAGPHAPAVSAPESTGSSSHRFFPTKLAAMDDDAPPGVAEWVVTYGDMMSLLLTFFIMLVSMSEVKEDEKYRAVMEALQHYLGYRAAP